MTTENNLEAHISSVEQSVEAGLSYFEDAGAESKVKIDLWTPREVLVHMVYWHQATVEGMEAVTSGPAALPHLRLHRRDERPRRWQGVGQERRPAGR